MVIASFVQAHREVFEYLIEDFKTYKPLLSAIKNEYEMMLAHQRQQIRHLEPLKVRLLLLLHVKRYKFQFHLIFNDDVSVSNKCPSQKKKMRKKTQNKMSFFPSIPLFPFCANKLHMSCDICLTIILYDTQ